MAAARGNGVLQYCIGQLLPALIEYIAIVSAAETVSPTLLSSATEVMKTFLALASSIQPQHRRTLLDVLVQTLLLPIDITTTPSPPLHTLAVQHLLALAAQDPAAFKQTTSTGLDGEQRVAAVTSCLWST